MDHFLAVLNAQNYFLNPHFTAPVFVGNLVLIFGFFIYQLEDKSTLSRAILYLCLSLAAWLYAHSFLISSNYPEVASFWMHILYLGMTFSAAAMFHVSTAISHRYPYQKKMLTGMYMMAGVVTVLTWSQQFVGGLKMQFFGYYPDSGPWHMVILLFILTCFVFTEYNLFSYYRLIPDEFERRRALFFSGAFGVLFLGYSDLLAAYGLDSPAISSFTIFGFVVSVSFFIIRCYRWVVDQRAGALESIIEEKTSEISKIVEELRKTQLKLFETGRISALASLSAGILHQVSQPITAIHGFVRFIKKEMAPTENFYKPICLMEEQTVYLRQMLEDLMNLIRHREIKKENIDINVLITRAVNLLTDELRIKRIRWETELEEDLPFVYADGIHLQQVFMNIIINAMQAIEGLARGEDRELIISTRFDKKENRVWVSFKDSGPGLSAEDREKIFEPFFSTKDQGAGIGLALCKDLVAEHGGKIGVTSLEGGGTTFTVYFPCALIKDLDKEQENRRVSNG